MNYQTLFSITNIDIWPHESGPLIGIIVGVTIFLYVVFVRPPSRQKAPMGFQESMIAKTYGLEDASIIRRIHAGWLAIVAAAMVIIGAFAWTSSFTKNTSLLNAYNKGDCEQVEGVVGNFEVLPYKGNTWERFWVQDHMFQFTDSSQTNGFHDRGTVKEGMKVRIWFKGDEIARLDVARGNI